MKKMKNKSLRRRKKNRKYSRKKQKFRGGTIIENIHHDLHNLKNFASNPEYLMKHANFLLSDAYKLLDCEPNKHNFDVNNFRDYCDALIFIFKELIGGQNVDKLDGKAREDLTRRMKRDASDIIEKLVDLSNSLDDCNIYGKPVEELVAKLPVRHGHTLVHRDNPGSRIEKLERELALLQAKE